MDRFDILIDSKLKPWLLEINYTPSFRTDTPLDQKIKMGVIHDTLMLINVSCKDKKIFLAKEKEKIYQRSLYGKTFRLSWSEKLILQNQAQEERKIYEDENIDRKSVV